MGWRGGGPWPGRGHFSQLPPWQRPGWIYGYGRGMGVGWKPVYGAGYSPYVCRRFPWLPRWWWANPDYGLENLYTKKDEEGETTQPRQPYWVPPFRGSIPYPPTTPFGQAPSPERERAFLEQQAEALRAEIEAIKKRLEEIKEE